MTGITTGETIALILMALIAWLLVFRPAQQATDDLEDDSMDGAIDWEQDVKGFSEN